jgi:DNA repair exonuclease SbcCD ATPase subunit
LDEINSPLDKSGVETLFVNIIKQLESKYKILVITHDDSLKERFENVLDVSKINGDSVINFSAGNIAS